MKNAAHASTLIASTAPTSSSVPDARDCMPDEFRGMRSPDKWRGPSLSRYSEWDTYIRHDKPFKSRRYLTRPIPDNKKFEETIMFHRYLLDLYVARNTNLQNIFNSNIFKRLIKISWIWYLDDLLRVIKWKSIHSSLVITSDTFDVEGCEIN